MDKHRLEIDSVELSFGDRQILSGLYLRVDTGSVTGLLGGNGAGKSCLMNILSGELQPTTKTIRIDSVWYKNLSSDQLLYLSQKLTLPKSISVREVLNDFRVAPQDFVDSFPEFTPLLDQKIGTLSGGERRIVEIYTLLKADSQFVLLDEPFSQIMPLHFEKIKSLICDAKKDKGILITDHRYRDVIDVSDTLYVIDNRAAYLIDGEEGLIKHKYINS